MMSPFCVICWNGFAYVFFCLSYILLGCGGVHGCQCTDVEVRGQSSEILSFHYMGSKYQSQIIRSSHKGLYTVSHFTVSMFSLCSELDTSYLSQAKVYA